MRHPSYLIRSIRLTKYGQLRFRHNTISWLLLRTCLWMSESCPAQRCDSTARKPLICSAAELVPLCFATDLRTVPRRRLSDRICSASAEPSPARDSRCRTHHSFFREHARLTPEFVQYVCTVLRFNSVSMVASVLPDGIVYAQLTQCLAAHTLLSFTTSFL